MKIGIVNYKLGNLGSVYSAFKFYNYDVNLINEIKDFKKNDLIVLAGVGNFKTAVSKLKELKFWDKLNEEIIICKKPVLGICLGMQLFAGVSYEEEKENGFGWIKGKVVKIEGVSLRVPHIGWDAVGPLDNQLFQGMRDNFFYFMHSYHFIPEDKNTIIATTKYGELEIVSVVRKDNITGVQFHPEKSQGDGLRFLKNFLMTIS
ncbi:MAG: imidazole glycerol phosphate synthase subunit HisH [Candidatus Omnitrophica bacterium]|nr:imidazole glycerol phosphate synthase subunit HisH [Candidatus Omnitrophota bacterium]MDD5352071.1 imidazole glycerol phosphate synthase subunit HisH [Candidatus Omnitrophota bacterium]MDD5549669.1 imidazole glycerol phosphate synthase subunit HisH [Candidatus Omnitrophota bacterium]